MTQSNRIASFSRRHALAFGGGLLAAGPAALRALASGRPAEETSDPKSQEEFRQAEHLPAPPTEIFEGELHTEGTVSGNVLSLMIPRGDLHDVQGPRKLTFTPAWEVHHEWSVQTLPSGEAMLNGEMALLEAETGRVIHQLVAEGLVFQAFHQHFTAETPQVWHIHMRGRGSARDLAKALAAVVRVTGTPFPPPKPPSNPSTPLDAKALARILGGAAHVRKGGVVTVDVPRKNAMRLGGAYVSPNLGIATHMDFMPLPGASGGSIGANSNMVAAAPDFGMTQDEVQKVMRVMDETGWDIECLYNQETDEYPQLYWSHQLKVGDATRLAHEIRAGLNEMDLKFKS